MEEFFTQINCSFAYKLHDHLEWLELIWVQPRYSLSGSAWAIVYETLQDLAKIWFSSGAADKQYLFSLRPADPPVHLKYEHDTSVIEEYMIYRAWEKNGCVFIKRGSETELAGKWLNVVRDNELSLELLRLPYETRAAAAQQLGPDGTSLTTNLAPFILLDPVGEKCTNR